MYVIKKIIFTQNSGIRIRNTVQTLSSPSYVLSPPPPSFSWGSYSNYWKFYLVETAPGGGGDGGGIIILHIESIVFYY